MFTGIIEETGRVRNISKLSNGALIEVECNVVLQDTKIGDSISINGVCETVTEIFNNAFRAKISDETLSVTTFSSLRQSDVVNLERALTLNSRLGGHIVSGHVDCVGKLINIEKLSDFYTLKFEIPEEQLKYVVYKGSVAINGISLTVAGIEGNIFDVAIIPHTYENTNFKHLNAGDIVNIETDILGKYIEKMLSVRDNKSNIDMEFLVENGFA